MEEALSKLRERAWRKLLNDSPKLPFMDGYSSKFYISINTEY